MLEDTPDMFLFFKINIIQVQNGMCFEVLKPEPPKLFPV